MESNYLTSLRLGFSTREASKIKAQGIGNYIKSQLAESNQLLEPDFMANSPRSLRELRNFKTKTTKGGDALEKKVKELVKIQVAWKAFLIQRYFETALPLQEKINLFFQNHFVVTLQSVKVPYWIYLHYNTIQKHSLGNYKTLVREMVYSNAMIKYLDNQQNRLGNINENLGRELLELFTLGEGNYTESDIKNAALALAGLSFGETKGQYRQRLKDDSLKKFMGKSGNFDADDIVDIIFEQKSTPFLIAEKVLKWFFYDNPKQDSIIRYGNLLKENDFELKPFFQQLLTEECSALPAGTQIKNPLVFVIQVFNDLNLSPNYKFMAFFLKNQGMDIYDQPNVKGWKGGRDWLTSQLYTNRTQLVDLVTSGNKLYAKMLLRRLEKFDVGAIDFTPMLQIENNKSAKTILKELTDRMVFETNEDMWIELNQLLKYDFDPTTSNARQNILSIYQHIAKTPEFQII